MRLSLRRIPVLMGVVIVVGSLFGVTAGSVAASDTQRLELRDDCDPTTFNATLGPGSCIGNGDTTFADFLAQLQKDRSVGAWRMNPDSTSFPAGSPLVVTNRGGETHTFTCVSQFGGGIVPLLNDLSGNTTPAAPCSPTQNANFVPAGTSLPEMNLAPGAYKFQFLIHPWMRTRITVEAKS